VTVIGEFGTYNDKSFRTLFDVGLILNVATINRETNATSVWVTFGAKVGGLASLALA
jgi:hypothetical protein